MRVLCLLLACCLGLTLRAEVDRILLEATINGQRVRLFLDTCASDSVLFRSAAERLKLKLEDASPGLRPTVASVRLAALTEPVDVVYRTLTVRTEFGVIDRPPFGEADTDGLLSWYPLRHQVLIFDATAHRLDIADAVPQRVLSWPKFKERVGSRLLAFETGVADPQHHTVYVDTGAFDGVTLNRSFWAKWVATRTHQPGTMRAFLSLMVGMFVQREMWANEIALGSLVLAEVPVRELDGKEDAVALFPDHAATLGLFALRRLDLVVDGSNEVVYARAREGPAPDYPHNQLGAVFAPRNSQSDPLVAYVAPVSPAYRAGIRDEDVLLRIDDLDVTKWRTDPRVMPLRRFWEFPAGTAFKLTLKRGEREYQTTVVLERILGTGTSGDGASIEALARQSEANQRLLSDFRAQAEKDDARAQDRLGTLLLSGGVGVAKDEGVWAAGQDRSE